MFCFRFLAVYCILRCEMLCFLVKSCILQFEPVQCQIPILRTYLLNPCLWGFSTDSHESPFFRTNCIAILSTRKATDGRLQGWCQVWGRGMTLAGKASPFRRREIFQCSREAIMGTIKYEVLVLVSVVFRVFAPLL